MFQGKTQEAKKLAEFEVEQKKREKLSLDEMKKKIDSDYKLFQVHVM